MTGPNSDPAWQEAVFALYLAEDKIEPEVVYQVNNPWHGKRAKRSIEGPQICTQATQLTPEVIRGPDFVAIRQSFQYRTAEPVAQTRGLA